MSVNSTKTAGFLATSSLSIAKQKKKISQGTFIRKRPTVLDNLPLDTISDHIFPYLDYETRINMNQCLPVWDRVQKKMAPQSLMKHQINYCVSVVGSILLSLEHREETVLDRPWVYRGDKRIQRIIQMLRLFLKDEYFSLYTNFEKFRRVFIAKIVEMDQLTHYNPYEDLYSKACIDEIVLTCNSLKDKILNYRGELKTITLDTIASLSFT
uniref:Uncharacterized protein n=1 Tax=viral metagenome TaxID=1070528 RepID=A0A6C0AMD5_9ZZZZ